MHINPHVLCGDSSSGPETYSKDSTSNIPSNRFLAAQGQLTTPDDLERR